MKQIVFATNNKNKLRELREIMDGLYEVLSLDDIGCHEEIIEDADTIEGNAKIKADFVTNKYHVDCFADDTGLEVEALGGAPGVYSARYAGEHCTFDDNIDKLLAALAGHDNRRACFRTVICLLQERRTTTDAAPTVDTTFFEGRVDGQILTERHSHGEGFGYDPVFMPDRFAVSFAEMPLDVKNRISHRGLAVEKLADYLSHTTQQ